MLLGCQTLSSSIRATMVAMAEPMSGRVGPWKLASRNWAPPKATPATMMAGSTSMERLKPHMTTQTHRGTIRDSRGS